jgi:hypothetical protein
LGLRFPTLKRVKEQAFAQDIRAFATDKYNATMTKDWKVMVQHVSDRLRWMDLYNVARHTAQDFVMWPDADAWSMAWDEPDGEGGWIHAATPTSRKDLARRMELENFHPVMAAEAINYDVLIFVNDPRANYLASYFQVEGYLVYVLTHECLHFVEDWSGKHLVLDNVPPWQDRQVGATLSAYVESLGGWNAFKQRHVD